MERMTISVPTAMARQIEARRKAEHRTRSGVIQEAFRFYDRAQVPPNTGSEEATPAELRAIAKGRAQIKKGEFYTLDEVFKKLDAMDRRRRKARVSHA